MMPLCCEARTVGALNENETHPHGFKKTNSCPPSGEKWICPMLQYDWRTRGNSYWKAVMTDLPNPSKRSPTTYQISNYVLCCSYTKKNSYTSNIHVYIYIYIHMHFVSISIWLLNKYRDACNMIWAWVKIKPPADRRF